MRQLLIATGIPQGSATSAQHIGPFPNLAKAILQLGIEAPDCNNNSVPDSCDIASGTSQDCNGNGVPDECESPIGACCVGTTCTVVVAQTCCSSQGGTFRGEGSTCQDCNGNALPDACEAGLRACCLPPSGPCVRWTTECCSVVGGEFFPTTTKCTYVTCGPLPSGPTPEP